MTALDESLGFLKDYVGDAHVAFCWLVEGGRDDFGLDGACHVGDFFGSLVDEEHHHVDFGVVLGNGVGDVFHEHGLTCLGLRYDEGALTFADGGKEVYHTDAHGVTFACAEVEFLVGEEGGEVLEGGAVAYHLRIEVVDALDGAHREVFVSGYLYVAAYDVAGLESVLPDLLVGDEDIVGRWHVVEIG